MSTQYRVTTSGNRLNGRSGPGTSYPVTTTAANGYVLTIVETRNGWAKSTGGHWYSLTYLTKVSSSATCGQTVNPYSVAMSGSTTVADFSTYAFRMELRRASYRGAIWFWIRSTVVTSSNSEWGSTARLVTPCGTVKSLPYGSGTNLTVGARRTTAAICVGQPASLTTVTFSGPAPGDESSKTVKA